MVRKSDVVRRNCRGFIPLVMAGHALCIYLLWMTLFISKWFPYGFMAKVREWLYRFF